MKNPALILMILFVVALFTSCEKNDENTQAASIYISHRNKGMRVEGDNHQRVYLKNIYLYGSLIGSPLPSMNYVQIGSIKNSDPNTFNYSEGSLYFSTDETIWEDQLDEPKFNPLKIIVSSSIGDIEGSVTIPDTIKTISINAPDQIALGTPFTVSWTGSNADYYVVEYYYQYMEEQYAMLGYSKDTVIASNSVTFAGLNFMKDGELSYFEIYPMNGPLPAAGSKPNMKGVGYGYIYTQNTGIESDKKIIVGNGIDPLFLEALLMNKSAFLKDKPDIPRIFAEMFGKK